AGQGDRIVYLDQDDCLVVPGLSFDGSMGYRMLSIARENIAFSIACDRFGQAFMGNMGRLGGILKTPNKLSDEAYQNLAKTFNLGANSAVDNSGKTAILEDGLEYTPFNITNEGGLYTETRKYQVQEVCRLFNISPVKLHQLENLSQYKSYSTLQ